MSAALRKRNLRQSTCRMCGRREDLTVHHLVPQRFGRDGNEGNLVALCERCHRRVEHTNILIREAARASLRASLTSDELLYVRGRKGVGWFNHHYPLAIEGDGRRVLRRAGVSDA